METAQRQNYRSDCVKLVYVYTFLRILLNIPAMQHYGFQRDEFLHIALGDHLDWGFKEVPPFIALIGKTQTLLFGGSVVAIRVFSTICSGLIILLTGLLTLEFGGRRFAISLACLALTFSPAFMGSGYLFQPVVFDQLWWLLSVYLLVKYFKSSEEKYLYLLGIAIGMGMLTKYTMAFFTAALIMGILISKERYLFTKKGIWIAAGIAFLIFLPNVVWQLTHHLPLLTHMNNLRSSMLDYIKPADFLVQQLLVNGTAILLWLPGICYLLFNKNLSKYRFLAYSFLFTLVLFLLLHGKIYYLFGAYPMLFAAGGFAAEQLISIRRTAVRAIALVLFTVPNMVFLPMILPVLPVKTALPVFDFIAHQIKIDFPFKWEDQKMHPLTQDYADMLGWDELTQKVNEAYRGLTPDVQKQTIIFADNYGEAGAIHHLGKSYNLPEVVSLNSSFALWAPEKLDCKYIIYIDERNGSNTAGMIARQNIGAAKKIGEVNNPLARELGTAIFLLKDLKPTLNTGYRAELLKTRNE